MKPRGFALLSFLPHLIGLAVVAGLLWGAWSAVNGWCNGACKVATERADEAWVRVKAADDAIARAQERATALALLWSEAIQRVEVRHVEVVKWRTRTFVEYRERAAGAEVSGTITLSPGAVSVLADSASAANDPGPAAGGEGTAAPVPEPAGDTATEAREWVEFAVEAAAAYADARDKWQACVSWAGAITQAEAK